jgi:hypothetical protein
MLRFLSRTLIAVAAAVGLAGTANAAFVPATWTDQVGGHVFIDSQHSYSYTHDLTDDGFNPGTDSVWDFVLNINLSDDGDGAREKADIGVGSIDLSLFGYVIHDLQESHSFKFDSSSFTLASGFFTGLIGLVELNDTGFLSVTLNSTKGDFWFGGSKLVAGGFKDTSHQVPEPGTLAMFGIGLVGVAAAARRRKARAA